MNKNRQNENQHQKFLLNYAKLKNKFQWEINKLQIKPNKKIKYNNNNNNLFSFKLIL